MNDSLKMRKLMEINIKNKIYKLEKEKLLYVLSQLSNIPINEIKDEEIELLMNKYKLFDELFLENINNLW